MSKHDDMNLTEEELAALEDGAEDDAVTDDDEDGEWEGAADDAEGDTKTDDADAGAKDDDAGEQQSAADLPSEDTVTALEAVYASVADAKLPDGFDDRVKAAQDKLEEIERQFDDGDLTTSEYKAALKDAQKETLEIERIKTVAENNANIREEVGKQLWGAQVNTFFNKDENAWYKDNDVAYNAMDAEVRKIATENPKMSGNEILRLANEKVAKAFGKTVGQPQKQPDGAKKADPKQPDKKVEKKPVPKTLANLPAAELQEAGDGGKFAWLDRLADKDPIRYEAELEKLSAAESNAYMACR